MSASGGGCSGEAAPSGGGCSGEAAPSGGGLSGDSATGVGGLSGRSEPVDTRADVTRADAHDAARTNAAVLVSRSFEAGGEAAAGAVGSSAGAGAGN